MAPSSEQLHIQASIVHLDEILLNRKSFKPVQVACRGFLPGRKDAKMVAYLARRYKIDPGPVLEAEDFLKAFEELIDHNARCTDAAGFYRLAQSWRIVNFIAINHLKERAGFKRKRILGANPQIQAPATKGSLSNLARKIMGEQNKSPLPTPESMKPVSLITRQRVLSDSASSHPTPLARPISNGKANGLPDRNGLPDPEKDEHLALPPLIAPTLSQSKESVTKDPQHDRRLTSSNLDGLQRFHQNSYGLDRTDMVRKWSIQPKEPLNLDPVDANGVKIPPRLEKRDSDESFAFLAGSLDSRGPSFPSSFASTGSGPPQMVAERPSRSPGVKDIGNGGSEALDIVNGKPALSPITIANPENLSGRPDTSLRLKVDVETVTNGLAQKKSKGEELNGEDPNPGSYPDEWGICAEQPKIDIKPKRNIEPSAPLLLSPPRVDEENKTRDGSIRKSPMEPPKPYELQKEASLYLPENDDIDLEENKPFTFVDMLREVVGNYASKGDAQTAAHLLMLLAPLLPRTHPLPESETFAVLSAYIDCFTAAGYALEDIDIVLDEHIDSLVTAGIQPIQSEAVLSTYHEQLTRLRLWNEAAMLRKLSFPTYPAVYDQYMKDNCIQLKCGDCGDPLNTGMESLQCESCDAKQATCPICWCNESPFDSNAFEISKQVKLLSTCLLCNHTGHTTCLRVWFDECGEGDGACPTQGCLCDCVVGTWRAEKAKLAERKRRFRSHSRVKSDDWPAQESKAVERTREVLGAGAGKRTRSGLSA